MCRWFDLGPLILGRLSSERLTSNQIDSQHRISFAWRHKQPICFFRHQRAGPPKLVQDPLNVNIPSNLTEDKHTSVAVDNA